MENNQAELLKLMKKIDSFINRIEKEKKCVHQTQKKMLQQTKELLSTMGKKEERILNKIDTALKSHENVLERMLSVNQNVDETLCSVLLAIRQNEYLQAWYPDGNKFVAPKPKGK